MFHTAGTFISLFCTAAILHVLCRIILHLNTMENAHLYVHMYVPAVLDVTYGPYSILVILLVIYETASIF